MDLDLEDEEDFEITVTPAKEGNKQANVPIAVAL